MDSKSELLSKLQNQLKLENLAKDKYLVQIEKLSDKTMIAKIKKIIADEINHIKTVNRMIEILTNYQSEIKIPDKKIQSEIKNDIIKNPSVLLTGTLNNYMNKLIPMIKNLERKKILYVSYNKIPKYTKQVFKEHNIDLSNILFVNCTKENSQEDININPYELTKLAITVSETSKRISNLIVIIDSLSLFDTFHKFETISKFVSSLNNKAIEQNYSIFWVSIDDDKSFIAKIGSLCSKVQKL